MKGLRHSQAGASRILAISCREMQSRRPSLVLLELQHWFRCQTSTHLVHLQNHSRSAFLPRRISICKNFRAHVGRSRVESWRASGSRGQRWTRANFLANARSGSAFVLPNSPFFEFHPICSSSNDCKLMSTLNQPDRPTMHQSGAVPSGCGAHHRETFLWWYRAWVFHSCSDPNLSPWGR